MSMPLWSRRAVQLGGAAACLLATTLPARAELVSLIIGSILAAVGVPSAVATVIANIVVIAAGVAIALLLAPKPPKPEGGTISVQQDNPPITYVYGDEVRVAGAIALKEAFDEDLIIIQALAGHEVEFTGTYYFNDDRFTLTGGIRSGRPTGMDGHKYNDVDIDTRLGLATETNYAQTTALSGGMWPSTARGDATASMQSVCPAGKIKYFTDHYPVGQPDPSAVISGTRIFDPRDEDQDPDDPTTFKFVRTNNVALQIIHFYCFSPYGPGKDYHKAIEPWLDEWITEIDLCDEFVPKKVGTERRFTSAGFTTTEQDDRSTLKVLRESCAGKLIELGDGAVRLWTGVFRAAEFTLTDADIIDCKLIVGREQPSAGNAFICKYTSRDNDWTTVPTDPFEWTEDQTRWGRREQIEIERRWIYSTGQASRILKRFYLQTKQATKGTLRLHWSGLAAAYEQNVAISSNTLPPRLRNCTIEVRKAVISAMTGIVTIDFVLTSAEIDAYDPATDESDPAPVPAKPAREAQYVPANVDAFAFHQAGSTLVSVDVSFDTPEKSPGVYRALDYRVQWRVQDIGGGVPGAWNFQFFDDVPATDPRTHLIVGVVPDNTILEVEVRSETRSKGTPSDWSDTVEVDTGATAVVPGFVITDDADVNLQDDADVYITEDA